MPDDEVAPASAETEVAPQFGRPELIEVVGRVGSQKPPDASTQVWWVDHVRVSKLSDHLQIEAEREAFVSVGHPFRVKAISRLTVTLPTPRVPDNETLATWASPAMAVAAHAIASVTQGMTGVPLLTPPNPREADLEVVNG